MCYDTAVKPYDYILFDWDGTVAKTLNLWMEALRDTLQKHGYTFTDQEIGADYELFRSRFSSLGSNTLEPIINEALALSDKNLLAVKLYENNIETFTRLKQAGKRLGIVTTSAHSLIEQLFEQHNMTQLFDVIVGGDDVVNQKPHAEPILKAIDTLAAEKSRTVMVGDSDKDILSARAAGIDSILFYPAEHAIFHDSVYLRSLEPTFTVKSYRDLDDLLTS